MPSIFDWGDGVTKVIVEYVTGSLNIYAGKTLVFNSSTLSSHPFMDKKLYYNSSLFLNKSIDSTSIGL